MAAGPLWRVYGASCTGATHESAGKPYEDAWRAYPPPADAADQSPRADAADQPVVAVAVADGHGHARHFRSARGAELAVDLATTLGSQLAHEVRGLDDGERVEKALRARIGRDLVAGWRSAVTRDIRARPITDAERRDAGVSAEITVDEMVYAYGATLLVAVAGAGWLMSAQIGDGDLFAVGANGAVQPLVDADPRLDGSRTTSLCQPDAYAAMRFGVLQIEETASGAVVLATDGYGNAQARADWQVAFGTDLATLAAAHGSAWIGEQLPGWVAECASFHGSGDDTTMAVMVIGGTAWKPSRGGLVELGPRGDEFRSTWAPIAYVRERLGPARMRGVLGRRSRRP